MIATTPQPPASASVPSSQRPIPLQGRRDLTVETMEFQGLPWWVLKDPVGLRYHRLQAEHYRVLGLLDGRRSLKEIRDELAKAFPAVPMSLADVQRMITSLHAQGLVWSLRPGQAGQLIAKQRKTRRDKLRQSLGSLLSIRLPGWDPDASLQVLNRWLSWIYHPVTGILACLLVVAAWSMLLVQFDEFRSRLPEFQQFFSWRNLVWLWLTLGATKVIHEFGHGLTCRHFGRECHEMGVMLLVFSPTLYCDVTDSWMLRDKWQRIGIAAGGMVIEIILSAIAIFVWWFTTPGLLNHLCLNVFFVTTITTVIFNANPLMRYDGYYMLSDWLGIPNLRTKATKQLQDTFAETCLGISSTPDQLMPSTGKLWFITYAIAATLYGWSILSAILLFLYVVLKPYGLQSIGVTMAVLSLSGIVGNIFFNVWRILAAPRNEPMSRPRTAATLVVVLVLVSAALAVPLPWYIEAPFLIEPHDVTHVMTPAPGQLVSFDVRPGEMVQQGRVLARLRDDEKEDQLRRLEVAKESQLAEIAMLLALELPGEHALAQKRLQTIESQIDELKQQIGELTIRAPIAGQIVASPKVPTPPQTTRKRLPQWSGHVGSPDNLGCLLPTRTQLLSIAPDHRMQAVLYLDQAHREDLVVGQPIQIKFEHLAVQTFEAEVVDIAREQSDVAPATLSSKLGGELASVTDREGRERLTSVAYQARVVLDQETDLLKPGLRGTARFLVERRSAAVWLWRAFRRTMHFRI
jgi:putative peptide zinc metalloprotease protein